MSGNGGLISFQRPEEVVPSVLVIVSIVVLAGTLAFMLLVPKPDAAGNAQAWASSRRRIADDIADTRRQSRRAQEAIRARVWRSDPGAVSAATLAQLTEQTARRGLKLTAFRPERPQAFEQITELRFDVQAAGPYAGVHALMDSLDAPGSRIVLRSAQITQSPTAGNAVTATLGLSAFVVSDPTLLPPPAPRLIRKNRGAHG